MKTIESKIKSIAESIGVHYVFKNTSQLNVELDKIDEPTIVYYLPANGTMNINLKRNRVYDAPEALIGFLAPMDEMDFEGEENDQSVEACKRMAIRFVDALNKSDLFEPIDGEIAYQQVYDYDDACCTGIIATLTLAETEGVSLCDIIKRDSE